MQAQEFERKVGIFKKAYGLAITVAPETREHLLSEFRHIKEALVNWRAKRGNNCETVMFTVVAEAELHEAARELLGQVYTGERDLSPILKSVKVLVGLLDKAGQPKAEYTLGET